MESQITIKMWRKTRRKLRMIYALTGQSQTSILDRLITAELERVQESKRNKNNQH